MLKQVHTKIYSYNGWVISYDVIRFNIICYHIIRDDVICYEKYGLNDIKMQDLKFLGYKKFQNQIMIPCSSSFFAHAFSIAGSHRDGSVLS